MTMDPLLEKLEKAQGEWKKIETNRDKYPGGDLLAKWREDEIAKILRQKSKKRPLSVS